MYIKKFILIFLAGLNLFCSSLFATDFTVASFNCGGISDHYDYIRTACMHKLAQERYDAESEQMAQLERIQNVALKILFSPSLSEQQVAQQEWTNNRYTDVFTKLTAHPDKSDSINKIWRDRSEAMLTTYKKRPVLIFDEEVKKILHDHIRAQTKSLDHDFTSDTALNDCLDITRRVMAERIFQHQLKYDIIALQEADYLDRSILPQNYDVRFSKTARSINGVAWDKKKFDLVNIIGNIAGRAFVVELRDTESNKLIAVASGHISGCNPFQIEIDEKTGKADSAKGDKELLQIIEALEHSPADVKILAMDSNVTAAHPRLSILKETGYMIDYSNYLEPTCTNPTQVINTRIDWIAVKTVDIPATVHNIPVMGVGLNSPQTNISDHKPVAARLSY